MQLQTKYFGAVECQPGELLRFERGLFGIEEEKEFCLLPFEGGGGSLLCFQSVQTPQLAFVAMNPFSLKPDYAPVLPAEELRALGVASASTPCALCAARWRKAPSTCAAPWRSMTGKGWPCR